MKLILVAALLPFAACRLAAQGKGLNELPSSFFNLDSLQSELYDPSFDPNRRSHVATKVPPTLAATDKAVALHETPKPTATEAVAISSDAAIVTMVRETLYGFPQRHEGTPSSPAPEATSSSSHLLTVADVTQPAHILNTLSHLKLLIPFFTWALRHPARAIAFVAPWLLRSIWRVLSYTIVYVTSLLYSSFLWISHKAVTPASSTVFNILASPIRYGFELVMDLAPFWITVTSALGLGAIMGATAGTLTSYGVIKWIEDAIRQLTTRVFGGRATSSRLRKNKIDARLANVPRSSTTSKAAPGRPIKGKEFDRYSEKVTSFPSSTSLPSSSVATSEVPSWRDETTRSSSQSTPGHMDYSDESSSDYTFRSRRGGSSSTKNSYKLFPKTASWLSKS